MHPSSPAPPVLTPQREPAFERRTVTFSTQNKVVKTVPNLVEIVESIKMPSPLTEATPTLQAADIADIAEIDPETDIAVKSILTESPKSQLLVLYFLSFLFPLF